jgi:formate dehydrogenase (coenzyme F420) beta subunit
MINELREKCRQLLRDGTVRVVIGYGQATFGDSVCPVFITRPEDVDQLVWNERCFANLTTYLTRKEVQALGKAAICVKPCDERAIVVLEKESQIDRSQLYVIGLACDGVGNPHLPKCQNCNIHTPPRADLVIGQSSSTDGCHAHACVSMSDDHEHGHASVAMAPTKGDDQGHGHASVAMAPAKGDDQGHGHASVAMAPENCDSTGRYDVLDEFMKKTPGERLAYWTAEFRRCIKCYACRQACPMCYCRQCLVDKNRPVVVTPSATLKGNVAWQITRAFHLAGRCVGCDECTRICPAGIDLRLLNLSLAKAAEEKFNFRAGIDLDAEPVVGAYREQDREDFIR